MKKFFIAFLLVFSSLVLSGCGYSRFFGNGITYSKPITKLEKIVLPEGVTVDSFFPFGGDGMLVVEKDGLKGLYNAISKKLVAPEFDAVQQISHGYFLVEKTIEGELHEGLISPEGKLVIDFTKKDIDYSWRGDSCVVFNYPRLYEINWKGDFRLLIEGNFDADLFLHHTVAISKNHIFVDSNDTLRVYKVSSGKQLYAREYKYISGRTEKYFILSDDEVLFQTKDSLPSSEAEYDIFESGVKYKFTSTIVNVKNGSSKNIKLEYKLIDYENYTINPSGIIDTFGNEKFTYANAYPIIDKRIEENNNHQAFIVLNEKGKVVKEYSRTLLVMKVSKNRFFVVDSFMNMKLTNARGKEKLDFYGKYSPVEFGENHIIVENYDNKMGALNYKGKEVIAFDYDDVIISYSGSVIFLKETESGYDYYFVGKKNKTSKIELKENQIINFGYNDVYQITNSGTNPTYDLYSFEGVKLTPTALEDSFFHLSTAKMIDGNYIILLSSGTDYYVAR